MEDLRGWLEQMRSRGLLRDVRGAGAYLEIALPMSRAVINACQPYQRWARGEFPRAVTVLSAVAERVRERYPEVLGNHRLSQAAGPPGSAAVTG